MLAPNQVLEHHGQEDPARRKPMRTWIPLLIVLVSCTEQENRSERKNRSERNEAATENGAKPQLPQTPRKNPLEAFIERQLVQSEKDVARAEILLINAAMKLYYLDKRRIPALEDLITPDERGRVRLKEFSEVPRDPWGNLYEIRKDKKKYGWEVRSWGPDKLPDTDDDLSSKDAEKKR